MPRRGESIYKRKDGRWEARYVLSCNTDGTKKYASVYAATYKGVREKRELRLRQQAELQPTQETAENRETEKRLVAHLATEWLASARPNIRVSTYQKYESLCKNHIIPKLGEMALEDVSRRVVRDFAEEMETEGRIGGGKLSRKTVNDCLTVLSLMFRFADEEYEILMPRISLLREEKRPARVLSKQEEQTLVRFLLKETDCFKFGVLLALYTGVRIGELCALKWEDISETNIYITKTMQRVKTGSEGTHVVIGAPKSSASRREIPMPSFLAPYVQTLRRKDGYVLYTSRCEFMEPRVVQDKFQQMLTQAGLASVNFHTLRHTFATRCVEAGFDAKTLSELLGHTDVKLTLNRYVHSSYTLKTQQMQKLSLPVK